MSETVGQTQRVQIDLDDSLTLKKLAADHAVTCQALARKLEVTVANPDTGELGVRDQVLVRILDTLAVVLVELGSIQHDRQKKRERPRIVGV